MLRAVALPRPRPCVRVPEPPDLDRLGLLTRRSAWPAARLGLLSHCFDWLAARLGFLTRRSAWPAARLGLLARTLRLANCRPT
jgi:hypothetical protein